ncbi:MAG: selenocysteine-specific translation elongation factor [Planctomycetes bacterium]|uniref:selenocysteine-specific translation elongation factor n=1 Tax=Candidatus Wunengus sp. YC65 TaxID=3367701 RepID=UPI001D1F0673|nr:selenocysteine-specific translation elongation factor [Planctomycetota bacterium]
MKQSASSQIINTHNVEHIIIGTAGHIDHGKTSLVKALTGIDTDRLPEEKQRGMTIDLGYAYLDLDSGQRVSIVDVPGHERFVKNMLAGATSINLVLFVIAADDGVMPQTIEHLEIINLLGIRHGLVALTKKDLVTDEWLAIVQEDIKNILKGTSLEDAPIVPVSTVTGEGIETCKTIIKNLIAQIKTRDDARVFRLPIDRSFTISGYGCVVTGPIMGGQISVEDEVEIFPVKQIVRIRGIEVTGERVNTAFAGQRAAINLSGIKSTEIKRGYELSIPGYLQPTKIVDASLRLIKSSKKPLKNRARIRFHMNTSEVMGRVILLDREQLNPGEEALCQFLLENLITIEREDRFIIRSYSPAYTIGGGRILGYNTTRLKRFKEESLKTLKILDSGSLFNIVEQVYLNNVAGKGGRSFALTIDDVSRRVNIHPSIAEKIIADFVKKGVFMKFSVEGKNVIFHKTHVLSLKERVLNELRKFHKDNPLKVGIDETHLKTLLGKNINPLLITAALSSLRNEKSVKITDNKYSLMNFKIQVSTQERGVADRIEDVFLKSGFTPPSMEEVCAKFGASSKTIISLLTEQKRLVEVEKSLCFHATALEKLKENVKEYILKQGPISVAQFRDLTKTSRKYAVPLLEYFDAIHFTKRTGDVRILL